MAGTKIEWTNKTWNPVTGCTKVSQGCKHCYAERMAARLQAMGQPHYKDGFKVTIHLDALELPLRWRKPSMIFVNSMSDLFHDDIPDHFIQSVFSIMERAKHHTFQILTKRAERMERWVNAYDRWLQYATGRDFISVHPNVWMGISAEDQENADKRIPSLLNTPAAVRFVSAEPLLGPIDLHPNQGMYGWMGRRGPHPSVAFAAIMGQNEAYSGGKALEDMPGLDWVICGCESGPHARPMPPHWARSLRDQCQEVAVPFFLKQMIINGKMIKMPELDGKVWKEFPNA